MPSAGLERLILVDPLAPVCAEWRVAFQAYPEVEVVPGRIEDLPEYDCVVAAGNSYGLMDGGIDLAIEGRFPGVESLVQQRIRDDYHGYQPVGTCLLIPTGEPEHPWVAHAPTMRVPGPLVGPATTQIHSAMWAALCAVEHHNRDSNRKIAVLACPGLGTLHGRVPPDRAARLMALAYGRWREPPVPPSWLAARDHEGALGQPPRGMGR
jgi:O-acetyl-ADP-ribose deacetylase (regulator of RNase III)